jgi:hypothetical protein
LERKEIEIRRSIGKGVGVIREEMGRRAQMMDEVGIEMMEKLACGGRSDTRKNGNLIA